ncbi:MAG: AI-2E family transporter [bacterium]|nr:AI-2E family transporter [bacterium]
MSDIERKIMFREEQSAIRWFKTFVIIAVAGFLLYKIIPPLKGIILLFLLGLIFAYLLDPLVSALENRGLPRVYSIITLFIAIGFVLYLAGNNLFPVIKNEIADLIKSVESEKINTLAEQIRLYLLDNFPFIEEEQINSSIQEFLSGFQNIVVNISRRSLSFLQGILSLITQIVIIPLIVFFVLKDGARLKRSMVSIVPNKYFEMFLHLFYKIDQQIGSYLRGQILDNAILAVFYSIGFYYLGIPFYIVFGVFSGMANIIPYIGPIIGSSIPIIVAIIETGSLLIVPQIIVLFVIVQIIDNTFIQPTVVAKSVDLHPLIIIFAVLTGGTLMGVIGMLFSVLAVGIIKVVIVEISWSYKNYGLGRKYRRSADRFVLPRTGN